MLQWTGEFENSGLGWVYSFETDEDTLEHSPSDKSVISIEGQGDCAWSLKSALQDFALRPLLQETRRLGLMVEAYSSEPALEFQEHIVIDRGTLLLEDCVPFEEFCVENASPSELDAFCKEKGITLAQLMSKVNSNGDYCEGGFENFGEFQNPFPFLASLSLPYKTPWGECLAVYPHMAIYEETNNLYLGLGYFDTETGTLSPYTDLTINLDELSYLQSAIDTKTNGRHALDFLETAGFGQITGTLFRADHNYPIFRFDEQKLHALDPQAFSVYATAHGREPQARHPSLQNKIQLADDRAGDKPGQKTPNPETPER